MGTLDLDAMVAVVLPACTAFEFELACTLAADPGYAAVLSHVAPVADTGRTGSREAVPTLPARAAAPCDDAESIGRVRGLSSLE